MATYEDELSLAEAAAMRMLFSKLKSIKPSGWSVIQGLGELILRPADRGLGKFSITASTENKIYFRIAFFSRSLNHWDGSVHLDDTEDTANDIIHWALKKVWVEQQRARNEPI